MLAVAAKASRWWRGAAASVFESADMRTSMALWGWGGSGGGKRSSGGGDRDAIVPAHGGVVSPTPSPTTSRGSSPPRWSSKGRRGWGCSLEWRRRLRRLARRGGAHASGGGGGCGGDGRSNHFPHRQQLAAALTATADSLRAAVAPHAAECVTATVAKASVVAAAASALLDDAVAAAAREQAGLGGRGQGERVETDRQRSLVTAPLRQV